MNFFDIAACVLGNIQIENLTQNRPTKIYKHTFQHSKSNNFPLDWHANTHEYIENSESLRRYNLPIFFGTWLKEWRGSIKYFKYF